VRLFIALDLPEGVRDALRDLQGRFRALGGAARWTRPEGMHITLKFAGHADAEKCSAIRQALGGISSNEPVAMQFRGLGFFPNERRPRVLWCGVRGSANLARLAGDIERALAPAGIKPEARAYVPHLTFARLASSAGSGRLVRAVGEAAETDFGATVEREFYLYESILKPSGAEYKKLAAYSFVKDAV